jgi:hypothetical protein
VTLASPKLGLRGSRRGSRPVSGVGQPVSSTYYSSVQRADQGRAVREMLPKKNSSPCQCGIKEVAGEANC